MAPAVALLAMLESPLALAGTRSVEHSGPQGGTHSATRTRTLDRQQGLYNSTRTRGFSNADGKSVSGSRAVERSSNGVLVNREVSAADGRNWQYQRSRGDGHKEVTRTGPEGANVNYTRDIRAEEDALIVERHLTGPEGHTRSNTRSHVRPDTP